MKVTVYLDVLSLWCLYADRSLDALLASHGDQISFAWKISLIRGTGPLGYPPDLEAWYYRRGAALTGEMLNPNWFEDGSGTLDANLVAEAARALGATDRTVYRALMDAAMVDGKPVHRLEGAAAVAARASGIDAAAIIEAARRPETKALILDSTDEMLSLGVDQRPVIICENTIPDRAVLSGVWAYEPISALCLAMARDEHRFLTFNRDHPEPGRHGREGSP